MRRPLHIAAGEPELHQWCSVCQLPTRVRVPLHIGSVGAPVAAVLEICPGCGTGHDRPSVAVADVPRQPREWHPVVAAAHVVHRWACRRRGLASRVCAYGACRWPGLYRNEHSIEGDEGQWRYVFCTGRHQRRWAAENYIVLTYSQAGG